MLQWRLECSMTLKDRKVNKITWQIKREQDICIVKNRASEVRPNISVGWFSPLPCGRH
jgi:hypothetical protein